MRTSTLAHIATNRTMQRTIRPNDAPIEEHNRSIGVPAILIAPTITKRPYDAVNNNRNEPMKPIIPTSFRLLRNGTSASQKSSNKPRRRCNHIIPYGLVHERTTHPPRDEPRPHNHIDKRPHQVFNEPCGDRLFFPNPSPSMPLVLLPRWRLPRWR